MASGKCKKDYLPYHKASTYNGAEEIVNAELKHAGISENTARNEKMRLVGLALSGGGIRSAIFALGVMQRLARKGWMEKIDYLSTVSGGGYIGSSLSWFLHHSASGNQGDAKFGLSVDDFPFGTHRLGRKYPDKEPEKGGGQDKAKILQALRQNGRYLTPGNGLTIFSLLGVFLRGTFLSAIVYFPFLVLFFLLLYQGYIIRPANEYSGVLAYLSTIEFRAWGVKLEVNLALTCVILLIAFSTMASVGYAIYTYFSRPGATTRYQWRRRFEKAAGMIIICIIGLTALGLLPLLHQLPINLGRDKIPLIGTVSMVFGFIMSVITFLKSGSTKNKSGEIRASSGNRFVLNLLTGTAIILLIYGIMLLAYSFVYELEHQSGITLWSFYIGWLFVSLIAGRYVNLNHVSVHRYYRDRLMETFMPNIEEVVKNGHHDSEGATDADGFKLSDICERQIQHPYHIINTNIVLVESQNRKFRGRGGDNFILSPLFCGSSATGWSCTSQFMNNEMTMATAMAISGAAANPDTGIGGEGPTRNRALSLLMSLLNIRLGYWAPHPNPDIHKREKTLRGQEKLKHINPLKGFRPNFFHPMLTSTAFGSFVKKIFSSLSGSDKEGSYLGKTEHSHFIELTDGGHFENLGIYELIRRKLMTIIVCDAASDPDYEFSDLANAIEKVRVDFGVVIDIDIKPLIPESDRCVDGIACASSGYVVGEIHYPDIATAGTLVYIKTTFLEDCYPDLLCYKKQNPLFPDQSTTDQFFDEKQFEAYRGLGNYIAKKLTSEYVLHVSGDIEKLTDRHLKQNHSKHQIMSG